MPRKVNQAGSRVALHEEVGEITLNQMLHEWALHDLGQHPADCGAGARQKVSAGSKAIGSSLPAQTVTAGSRQSRTGSVD